MANYIVGREGFNTYQEAQRYAQRQGYGSDAIRDNTPHVDVIDRESKQFVARDVPQHEAEAVRRGSPAYTTAPVGNYNEESVKGVSYSADRGPSRPQLYVQTESGQSVNVTGLTQEQFRQTVNLDRAIAKKPQLSSMRESVTDQIRNPERYRSRTDFAARDREEQDSYNRAEAAVNRAVNAGTAGESLGAIRDIPPEYQTYGTLMSVREGIASRADSTPTTRREFAEYLFTKQGKKFTTDDDIITIQDEIDRKTEVDLLSGKVSRLPSSAKSYRGFDESLGTGEFPWYSQGVMGKVWAFGRSTRAGYRDTSETVTELGLGGSVAKDTFNIGKAFVMAPYQIYKKTYKEPVGKLVDKAFPESAEMNLREIGNIFYARSFLKSFANPSSPYTVAVSKELGQVNNKKYRSDKFNDFPDGLAEFHGQTKSSGYLNVPKRLGYTVLGLGTGITRITYNFGRYALKNPAETGLFIEGLGWLQKGAASIKPVLGKVVGYGAAGTFVGSAMLSAPSGQRIREGIETVGFFGIPAISKMLPKFSYELLPGAKAEPARGLPDVAKGRAPKGRPIDAILNEAGVFEPMPKGIRGLTDIKPAIVKARRTPGIERVPAALPRAQKGADFYGIDFVKPTTGADFRGVLKVPGRPEPKRLTKKGNVIREQYGIEEGNMLLVEEPKLPKKIRVIGADIGTYGYPLMTITSYGKGFPSLQFGKPSFSNKIPLSGISELQGMPQPKTASAGVVLRQAYDFTAAENQRVGEAVKIGRLLGKDKGLTVKEFVQVNVPGIKYPKKVTPLVEDFVVEGKGKVFGSFLSAPKGQLPEPFTTKKPGDIDVMFKDLTVEQIRPRLKKLTKKLQKSGEDVELSPANDNIIQFRSGQKFLEAKSGINQEILGLDDIAPSEYLGFNLETGKTVKFGKARAITAGEQLLRKGAGALMIAPGKLPGETKSFSVPGVVGKQGNPRGLKDIAGFVQGGLGLSEIRARSYNPVKRARGARARSAIDRFLSTYTGAQQKDIKAKLFEKTNYELATSIAPEVKSRNFYRNVFYDRSFYPSQKKKQSASVSRYSSRGSYASLRSAYKSLYASKVSRSSRSARSDYGSALSAYNSFYGSKSPSKSAGSYGSLSSSFSPSSSSPSMSSIASSLSSLSRSLSPSRSGSPRSKSPSKLPYQFKVPKSYLSSFKSRDYSSKASSKKQGFGYFYREWKLNDFAVDFFRKTKRRRRKRK